MMQPQNETEALRLIDSIFQLPKPREEKCRSLYALAQRSMGNIVELGTYHGNGAVALCLGKDPGQIVYTVDDYKIRTGWAGETYGPDDKRQFIENCVKAGVYPVLIEKSVTASAEENLFPIGMLYWDIWYDLKVTLDLWFPLVMKGGLVVIHETIGQERFGARDWMTAKIEAGQVKQYEVMSGGIHVGVKI